MEGNGGGDSGTPELAVEPSGVVVGSPMKRQDGGEGAQLRSPLSSFPHYLVSTELLQQPAVVIGYVREI